MKLIHVGKLQKKKKNLDRLTLNFVHCYGKHIFFLPYGPGPYGGLLITWKNIQSQCFRIIFQIDPATGECGNMCSWSSVHSNNAPGDQ